MISWFEKHNTISLIIAILMAIFIFYISSQSFEAGSPGPEFMLKPLLYHFFIFLLFSFFLLISLIKGEKIDVFFFSMILLISILYSISDEFHQLFVPGRTCSLSDILTDSAGVLFAGFLYVFRIKYENNPKEEYDSGLYY